MSIGKYLRLSRILEPESRTAIIIPMDHSVEGYFSKLENPREIIKSMLDGGANAFLLRRGVIKNTYDVFAGKAGLIYRVTTATGTSGDLAYQTITSSVEEAIKLGADAVVDTVFVGHPRESDMIQWYGILSDVCDEYEMPLVGEVDVWEKKGEERAEFMRQGVRSLCEEGADFIKAFYTDDLESFRKVVKNSLVPLVIGGGPKKNTVRDFLIMVKDAIEAGAIGTCIGRNIWEAENPIKMTQAVAKIVREKSSVEEALKLVR